MVSYGIILLYGLIISDGIPIYLVFQSISSSTLMADGILMALMVFLMVFRTVFLMVFLMVFLWCF